MFKKILSLVALFAIVAVAPAVAAEKNVVHLDASSTYQASSFGTGTVNVLSGNLHLSDQLNDRFQLFVDGSASNVRYSRGYSLPSFSGHNRVANGVSFTDYDFGTNWQFVKNANLQLSAGTHLDQYLGRNFKFVQATVSTRVF